MNIKKGYLIAFFVFSLLICVLDYIKGILASYSSINLPLGMSLISNMVSYLVGITYIIALIMGVIILRKTKKWEIFVFYLIFFCVVIVTLFMRTNSYALIDYVLNKDTRTELINSINDDNLKFIQCDVDTYWVGDLRLSNDGLVVIKRWEENTAVLFTSFRSFKRDNILIYTSDVNDTFENFLSVNNIIIAEKISDNWYLAWRLPYG